MTSQTLKKMTRTAAWLPWDVRQVYTIKVKPHDQARVMLGDFVEGQMPKGFYVEAATTPEQEDAIVTEVLSLDNGDKTRMFMHIANFGPTTLPVKVCRL